MQIQTFGYFGMQVVRNVNQVLKNPFTVSDLTQLSGGHSIEIKNSHDKLHLDMIPKATEGLITKTYL